MLALALALAPAAAAAAAPPAHFVFLLSDDTCGPRPPAEGVSSPRYADTQTPPNEREVLFSRGVDRLFIAAHASNVALIPVPGIEGSAAAAQEFCQFIHQAEAHGISIELL